MNTRLLPPLRRVRASLLAQRLDSRPITQVADKLTLSSVTGPTTPPLSDKTLYDYFSEVLAQKSSRPALLCRTERPGVFGGPPLRVRNLATESGTQRDYLAWDYEEFNRNIMALARGLVELGVKKGDRVGVIMGNNRCVRHGLVAVKTVNQS